MMVLEWTWFGVLTSASTLIILLPIGQHPNDIAFEEHLILRAILAAVCTFIALTFSWPAIGEPIRAGFEYLLPQKGTTIQQTTAGTLTLALCVVYFATAIYVPIRIALILRKRKNVRARSCL
jgi:hypothetical protein